MYQVLEPLIQEDPWFQALVSEVPLINASNDS